MKGSERSSCDSQIRASLHAACAAYEARAEHRVKLPHERRQPEARHSLRPKPTPERCRIAALWSATAPGRLLPWIHDNIGVHCVIVHTCRHGSIQSSWGNPRYDVTSFTAHTTKEFYHVIAAMVVFCVGNWKASVAIRAATYRGNAPQWLLQSFFDKYADNTTLFC